MLIAAVPDTGEVVTIGPGQIFDCAAQVEYRFHGVAETGVADLVSYQTQLYAAFCVVAKVEADAVGGNMIGKVHGAAGFLFRRHAAAVARCVTVAVQHDAHLIVVVIHDVVQLAYGVCLCLF